MKWGRDHEEKAREDYAKKLKVNVASRGLMMAECGFIGCSPDGIVFDSAEGEGLLEVKCPYSVRDMDVETGCLMLDNFCASLSPGGTPTLK